MNNEVEKVEITDEHLSIIRKKYKECEGMTDEQVIEAILHMEKYSKTVLGHLCYPTFDCNLRYIKSK